MYQLSKDTLKRAKTCNQRAVKELLDAIYLKYDKQVHAQKELTDIRYSQGVCYIVEELLKLTQPDHR